MLDARPQTESPLPGETIRAAASVILLRKGPTPRLLMGQRGRSAVFMPSKFVFPGGAVDPGDNHALPLPLDPACERRLAAQALHPAKQPSAAALVGAALRELQEETGLTLATAELRLRHIFRAITPPGRSRRFDARFFLIDAAAIQGDPDDFSQASDELSALQWIGLDAARALDLPFITEVVLAEIAHIAAGHDQPGLPFFDNSTATPTFRRIA